MARPENIRLFISAKVSDRNKTFAVPLTGRDLTDIGFCLYPWGYVREDMPLIRFSLCPKERYWIELGNGFRINLPTVETLKTVMELVNASSE